jgi:hypothetical protein
MITIHLSSSLVVLRRRPDWLLWDENDVGSKYIRVCELYTRDLHLDIFSYLAIWFYNLFYLWSINIVSHFPVDKSLFAILVNIYLVNTYFLWPTCLLIAFLYYVWTKISEINTLYSSFTNELNIKIFKKQQILNSEVIKVFDLKFENTYLENAGVVIYDTRIFDSLSSVNQFDTCLKLTEFKFETNLNFALYTKNFCGIPTYNLI